MSALNKKFSIDLLHSKILTIFDTNNKENRIYLSDRGQ